MHEKILRTVTYTFIGIASLVLGTHLVWRWYGSPERIRKAQIATWERKMKEFSAQSVWPPKKHMGTFVFNVNNSHETR